MSFAEFQADLDKIWSSTKQEVGKKVEASVGIPESKLQVLFDENLRKAYNAFLQCFRNHALVVDKEVTRIKSELTEQLEENYGEKLTSLRKQAAESASLVQKRKDEVVFLNGLVLAQDNLIAAAKHKYDLENTQIMHDELAELKTQLATVTQESADKSFQLSCSDQLADQLRSEVNKADGVLRAYTRKFEKEKKELETQLEESRALLKQKENDFKQQMRDFQNMFAAYKKNAEKEIEIQALLNKRRAEAVKALEEERRRHLAARSKPTPRIGNPEEPPERDFKPYDVLPAPGSAPAKVYRLDAMGKDQAWKEYRGSDTGRRQHKTKFCTLPTPRTLHPGPPQTPTMPTVVPMPPKS